MNTMTTTNINTATSRYVADMDGVCSLGDLRMKGYISRCSGSRRSPVVARKLKDRLRSSKPTTTNKRHG